MFIFTIFGKKMEYGGEDHPMIISNIAPMLVRVLLFN